MGQRIERKQNWATLLNDHFLKNMKTPFRRGRHDCCYAVARCIKVMTDVSVIKSFPPYVNTIQAEELIKEYNGVIGIARAIAKEFNLKEINVKRAGPGDAVILEQEKGVFSLGIVGLDGRYVYAAKKPNGWGKLPISFAITAWKI